MQGDSSAEELLRRADACLYRSKRDGTPIPTRALTNPSSHANQVVEWIKPPARSSIPQLSAQFRSPVAESHRSFPRRIFIPSAVG